MVATIGGIRPKAEPIFADLADRYRFGAELSGNETDAVGEYVKRAKRKVEIDAARDTVQIIRMSDGVAPKPLPSSAHLAYVERPKPAGYHLDEHGDYL